MMWPLIEASILTAAVYTGGVLTKHKMQNYVYVWIFLVSFFGAFFLGSTLHASPPNAKVEIYHLQSYLISSKSKLSPEDKKFYEKKVKFHKSNGDRCFNDVKNKCAWLPDFNDRDNAKFCLLTAATLVSPADPLSKLIGVIIETCVYYGLNVIDEWDYIQNKLHWAGYHYEMYEWYQEVLQQNN